MCKGICPGGDVWESVFLSQTCVQVLCVLVSGSKGRKSELEGIQLYTEDIWS